MSIRQIISVFALVFLVPLWGESQSAPVKNEGPRGSQESGYSIFSAFGGKPGKAGLFSVILPGAGQLYNKRYWKIPLALALDGVAIGILVYNINQFNEVDDAYRMMLNNEITSYRGLTSLSDLARVRNSIRQNMEFSWLGVIVAHIFVAADAFVDRHLMEFDVSDDLSIELKFNASNPGLTLSIKL